MSKSLTSTIRTRLAHTNNRQIAIVGVLTLLGTFAGVGMTTVGFQTWFGANTSGWPATIVTFFQYFVPALALIAYGYMYFRTAMAGGSVSHEYLVSAAIIIPVSVFIGGLLIPLGVQHFAYIVHIVRVLN